MEALCVGACASGAWRWEPRVKIANYLHDYIRCHVLRCNAEPASRCMCANEGEDGMQNRRCL